MAESQKLREYMVVIHLSEKCIPITCNYKEPISLSESR